MSSPEDEQFDSSSGRLRKPKKRRVARACDICRRRKVRCMCDGEQGPGRKCANCAAANLECSYVQAMKKYPAGYVDALEQKLAKLEAIIKRLHPTEDFTREIGIPLTRDNWMFEGVLGDPEAVAIPGAYLGLESVGASSSDELNEIDDKLENLTRDMQRMQVGAFRGKSSGAAIVQATLEIRREVTTGIGHVAPGPSFMQVKRPDIWTIREWEKSLFDDRPASSVKFPELDLMWNLVDAYFAHINLIHPVLHRPTFVKSIQDGLHEQDAAFGGVVLLVCAIGSRVADDRRVLSSTGSGDGTWHSAGWPWFAQVNLTQKSLLSDSRLYDLQLYCLSVIYLLGTSLTHCSWNLCGIGIRLAQDIGAHRKNVYNDKPTVEDELYKRAFWVLIWLDRWQSTTLGRQCALQDDDFDLELPCECDDEYWEPTSPELAFKQPVGKPSRVTYFVQSIKLARILGSTLNSIYGTGKARARAGFTGPNWEQRVTTDLSLQLRSWTDDLPEHLRWDPARQDRTFFVQSVHLHVQHNHIAILVHRPFISPRKDTARPYHSLTAALTAARSTSRAADALRQRVPSYLCPYLQIPVMVAGVMLHLGIWHIKRSGLEVNQEKEVEGVYKCMYLLADTEVRWQSAGRLWDVVSTLTDAVADPAPKRAPKRGRLPTGADADTTDDHSSPSASTTVYASSSATAYTSSPSSAPSSSPLAPLESITPDPHVHLQPVHLHPVHSTAVSHHAPATNLMYEPAPPPATQPAPSAVAQPTASDPGWGHLYMPGVPSMDSNAPGSYQTDPPGVGPPVLAYDPYDYMQTRAQDVRSQDAYGTGYAAGTAYAGSDAAQPGVQPTYQTYGGAPAPAHAPVAAPSANAQIASWQRMGAVDRGSLADAVPPEHRWYPARSRSQSRGRGYTYTNQWPGGSQPGPS